MKKKALIRTVIILVLLAAGGWAGYVYGIPALAQLRAGMQQPTIAAPVAYQTARVRSDGLDTAITTSGAVRSKQTALLIWQTSGTVSRVSVVTGQAVDAKTVLAELEQTSLPQPVILARAELVSAQKALDTLLQSTQARANAQMALVKAQQALDDAQDNRGNKLYQRASAETIDIARAHLVEANEALDQAEDFFNGHSSDPESLVYASGLSRLAKARQEQIRAKYNLDYVTGLPEPLDIEEADARIAVAEANVLQARLDWERVKDGPNEDDVSAAEARIAAAQATLNLAHISSPFNGTLTLVNSKVGDQITAGVTGFQIDDLSHLYLDVAVVEDEIDRVQVGLPAAIRFDALPGKDYPGVVTEIASVGKPTAGTVNFTVTVKIQQPGAEIKPGMTASVRIITGQGPSTLRVPSKAVQALNGQTVVYLLKDGSPAPVSVTTGAVIDADTVITAGALKAGDLVVLNPETPQAALPASTIVPLPAQETTVLAFPPAPQPALTATTTANPNDLAIPAAQTYFQALEAGDYQAAAEMYSSFSLMMAGMTRAEAALELQGELARGSRWSALEVKETRALDDRTMLVRVTYSLEGKNDSSASQSAQMDEWWPMRLENGRWLYNRANLIDYRVLEIPEQAAGGLIVKPLQLTRYSDRIRLTLMVQNTTNEAIVFGQTNEIMAAFQFKEQQVEAVKKQLIFNRLRTNPQVTLDVLGLYESYPDSVIIRQWKNIKVKPWFTFEFTERGTP